MGGSIARGQSVRFCTSTASDALKMFLSLYKQKNRIQIQPIRTDEHYALKPKRKTKNDKNFQLKKKKKEKKNGGPRGCPP